MTRASDLAKLLGAGGSLSGALSVDTISEKTSGSGVTIDSLNIKDSGIGGNQIGGRRNIVINGAMQVAQRGTSSTDSGYSTLDRFAGARGTVTATQSQESLTSSDSPYSLGFRNYFRMTNTGVTASTASYLGIRQTIEAQNIASSGWDYTSSSSYITISFWVRSSLAGTYYLGSKTFDGTEQYYATPITVLANTWTKFTHSISGNSNNTIDTNNEAGFQFYIWMHLGTDYTTSGHTVNQWAAYSSTDQAPDYPQNWNNTGSATFDITGVQLEVGSVATPFEHRSFGEELALCQRYFLLYADGNELIGGGGYQSSTFPDVAVIFPIEMRADPTLVQTSGSDYYGIITHNAVAVTFTDFTVANTSSPRSQLLYPDENVSGTQGSYARFFCNSSGRISYDAEL
jgi:hypothetical protein